MGKSVRIKDVLPKWKRIQRRSPFWCRGSARVFPVLIHFAGTMTNEIREFLEAEVGLDIRHGLVDPFRRKT